MAARKKIECIYESCIVNGDQQEVNRFTDKFQRYPHILYYYTHKNTLLVREVQKNVSTTCTSQTAKASSEDDVHKSLIDY